MITSTLDHGASGGSGSNSLGKILLFCSTRAWRGNFRGILLLSTAIFTTFLIFGLLPTHLSGNTLSSYKNALSWTSSPPPQSNLRIVVFGSPDVMGSAVDSDHGRTTWTEELCAQMNCTSHVSFVPQTHGLVSNSIYAKQLSELREITEKTNITEKPALDYNFINEQYPVPNNTPDLAAQIETFLAMPSPEAVPHETLWVFSFGTWEIWNLASMPLDIAEEYIDHTIDHIFEQVEALYTHALDPKSVAFSDFWSNATESQISELTDPDAIKKVDERKLESFRIMIPKLFDITITPGWKGRPAPTFPNMPSDHTRSALWLTRYWNNVVDYKITHWKKKAAKKPEGYEQSDVSKRSHVKRSSENEEQTSSLFDWLPSSMRPKVLGETQADHERVIVAPYPYRNGVVSNGAQVILDAMTEGEMHRADVHDSVGHGTLAVDDINRYLDVWSPCVKAITDDLTVDMAEVTSECAVPHDHLFYDAFTVSQRAIVSLSIPVKDKIMDKLFVRQPKTSWFY